MNADSTFQIGKDHIVCEDYALAEVKAGLAYAVICDGCSASPDVDLGARVMAMAAKNAILKAGPLCHDEVEAFGNLVILSSNKIYDVLPRLHPQALDATLLAAWVHDNKATVVMHGDGVMVRKYDDQCQFIHIHLTSGAPDYLSYHLESSRMDSYKKMTDNQKVVVTQNLPEVSVKPFEPIVFQTEVREGDMIAVMSDGIGSFRDSSGTEIEWQNLIEEFTGFKATQGEFVRRRLGAFKRKCIKENITHSDDISIAAIVV